MFTFLSALWRRDARRLLFRNCESLKPCFSLNDAYTSMELSCSWNLLFSLHSNFTWIVSNLSSLVCMLVDVKMLSALEMRTNLENQTVIWEQEWCSINGFIVNPMDAAVVLQQLRVAKFLDACVVQRWVKLISYMVCRTWGCTWHSSAILAQYVYFKLPPWLHSNCFICWKGVSWSVWG